MVLPRQNPSGIFSFGFNIMSSFPFVTHVLLAVVICTPASYAAVFIFSYSLDVFILYFLVSSIYLIALNIFLYYMLFLPYLIL